MKERTTALLNLIGYNAPLENLLNDLQSFPWDSDVALAVITRAQLRNVLQRFIAGELNSDQIEAWANALEVREDIDYEPPHREVIQESIHQLANPLLTEDINHASVIKLLQALDGSN